MSFDDVFRGTVAIDDAEPHTAARNMALDEALLLLARTAVLRVYRWQNPAVSFGYFGKFAAIQPAWPGREIVRRTTGGGSVPHGEDITYTLAAPADHPLAQLSARESYRCVHALLAQWLAGQGLDATLAESPTGRGNGACFESPVEADVLGAHGKLAGAAQRRTRQGWLLQGSIQSVPLAWSADLPAVFAARETRSFTAEELALANQLTEEKYGTREWTERV